MQQILQARSSVMLIGTQYTTFTSFLSLRCLCDQSWCKFGFEIECSRLVPVVSYCILSISAYLQAKRTKTHVRI